MKRYLSALLLVVWLFVGGSVFAVCPDQTPADNIACGKTATCDNPSLCVAWVGGPFGLTNGHYGCTPINFGDTCIANVFPAAQSPIGDNWAQIDLGASYNVTQVKIKSGGSISEEWGCPSMGYTRTVTVYASTSGSGWLYQLTYEPQNIWASAPITVSAACGLGNIADNQWLTFNLSLPKPMRYLTIRSKGFQPIWREAEAYACPSSVTISGTVTNAPANSPTGVRVCTNTGLCSAYGTGTFSYSIANVPTSGGSATYTLTPTTVSGYSVSPINVNPVGCTNLTGKDFAYNCVPSYSCSGKCGFIDNGCGTQVSCGSCGTVTAGTGPGVVGYKNTLNSGAGNISSKNWKVAVDSVGIKTKYGVAAYWIPALSGRASILSNATIGGSNSVDSLITTNTVTYYRVASGDLTISDTQNITKDKSVVFIVENGNLNINAPIRRGNKKTYLGFFVKGNITVANNLTAAVVTDPVVDGMFVADGVFSTGAGTNRFIGNGVFVAFAGVTLARDLGSTGNATSPASSFIYDPSLVISAPSDLARSSYTWSEVAP